MRLLLLLVALAKPDLVPALAGYDALWKPTGDLHGLVRDGRTLARNDRLVVWINRHATARQRFRALQDAEYDGYDPSLTIADGLGSVLGPLYVKGRRAGDLPLTSALINSEDGTTGAYLSTGDAKARFAYPRPYLPAGPGAAPVEGDDAACAPAKVDASSLTSNRRGKPWAGAAGRLRIRRVPDAVDTTHAFAAKDVTLSADYQSAGICTGGSYPSGHTTTAYQAGITLATLLPELAPEVLARASEAGNDRVVLGVHYPLDIVGGRIDGEVALATRWADRAFREARLEPARRELVRYLERTCAGKLAHCVARQQPYRDDPYGGARVPGGTAQVVSDRRSALRVYRERVGYGFAPTGRTGARPSVPAAAPSLLRSAFPTLTDAQRRDVLAQTQVRSGHPLDRTGTAGGSWQRLDLAAASSAIVRLRHGAVRVVAVGSGPRVMRAR